jgi:hypothetical protein
MQTVSKVASPIPCSQISEEQLNRMTLQVGLVGSDGIVLASDKCVIGYAGMGSVYDHSQSRKIENLAKHGMAYAYSGDETAVLTGRELARKLDGGTFDFDNVATSLENIGDSVFKLEEGRLGEGFYRNVNRKLLVVDYRKELDAPQLWELVIQDVRSMAKPIYDKIVVGDYGNSARFFQYYYRSSIPIEKLKQLAAQIIVSGHKVNPFAVEGLDIASIDAHGFQWSSDEEIKVLEYHANIMDAHIHKHLVE